MLEEGMKYHYCSSLDTNSNHWVRFVAVVSADDRLD